jgi:hypothetical protein
MSPPMYMPPPGVRATTRRDLVVTATIRAMSVTLATALLLQFASLALLRMFLGRSWLRRPAVLLVLAWAIYTGLSPALLAIPSLGRWDNFRTGIAPAYLDEAALVMSAGMLAFAVAYLLVGRYAMAAPEAGDIAAAARVLDWRLLALACAPLAVLTYHGRGYNASRAGVGAAPAVTADLAAAFFVVLIVVAAFAFVLHHGARWMLPVLAVQSVIIAAAGERTPVIVAAVALAVMLSHAGFSAPRRQIAGVLAMTAAGVLAITGARAQQGRHVYYSDSGLGARVSALAGGLSDPLAVPPGTPGVVAQAAARLDGTAFPAAILQSVHLGQPRLSAAGVPESLLLGVPSVAWSSKLSHARELNPVREETRDFGLQPVNFLPGLGMYAGFLAPGWLLLFLAALGAVAGAAERWLFRRWTPARMVLLAGAVTSALRYEQGLQGMLIALRTAVVIAVAAKALEVVLARRRVPQSRAAHT